MDTHTHTPRDDIMALQEFVDHKLRTSILKCSGILKIKGLWSWTPNFSDVDQESYKEEESRVQFGYDIEIKNCVACTSMPKWSHYPNFY